MAVAACYFCTMCFHNKVVSLRPHLVRFILLLCCFLNGKGAFGQRYPFFNIGIEQGLIQSQVFALAQDEAGHLWAATLGGLSCYDGKTFRSFTVRDGLPSNTITALCCDKGAQLWIGTERGSSRYDGHRFYNYTFTGQDNPNGNAVKQLLIDKTGTLWCLAGKGLFRMWEGKINSVSLPNGYESASAISASGNNGLWVAVSDAGALYHLADDRWDSTLLPKPTFIRRLYEDSAGRLVLISTAGLYRREADGTWKLLLERKTPVAPLLYSFAQDRDGSYWVSTTAGVIQLINGTVRHFTKEQGFTDVLIYDMLHDREGNLWFASNGEGLFRFSGAQFTAVDERMGLTGPQVSSIAQDAQGAVYFGSFDGGLYMYKDEKLPQFLFRELECARRSQVSRFAAIRYG